MHTRCLSTALRPAVPCARWSPSSGLQLVSQGVGPPPVHLLPDPDVCSGSSRCSARAWVLHVLPGEAQGRVRGPWTTLGGEAPAGFSCWTNSPVLLSCSPLSFPDCSSDSSAPASILVPLLGSLLPCVRWFSEGCIADKESSSTASERFTWGWKKGGRGKCVLCKACCVVGQHQCLLQLWAGLPHMDPVAYGRCHLYNQIVLCVSPWEEGSIGSFVTTAGCVHTVPSAPWAGPRILPSLGGHRLLYCRPQGTLRGQQLDQVTSRKGGGGIWDLSPGHLTSRAASRSQPVPGSMGASPRAPCPHACVGRGAPLGLSG